MLSLNHIHNFFKELKTKNEAIFNEYSFSFQSILEEIQKGNVDTLEKLIKETKVKFAESSYAQVLIELGNELNENGIASLQKEVKRLDMNLFAAEEDFVFISKENSIKNLVSDSISELRQYIEKSKDEETPQFPIHANPEDFIGNAWSYVKNQFSLTLFKSGNVFKNAALTESKSKLASAIIQNLKESLEDGSEENKAKLAIFYLLMARKNNKDLVSGTIYSPGSLGDILKNSIEDIQKDYPKEWEEVIQYYEKYQAELKANKPKPM